MKRKRKGKEKRNAKTAEKHNSKGERKREYRRVMENRWTQAWSETNKVYTVG